MEEKTLAVGKLKDSKLFCILLPVAGLVGTLIYNCSVLSSSSVKRYYHGAEAYAYAFGFGNGANYVLYPLIIVLALIGFIIYKRWSKVQITVTDKRVYGVDALGKRVDLPIDSITAVGTSNFSGLAVTTASGAIKFAMLKNRDELHEVISKLLIERQSKSASSATIKQEVPQSSADELKKFKELFDSGVITQEEFDAKKKQLLGL